MSQKKRRSTRGQRTGECYKCEGKKSQRNLQKFPQSESVNVNEGLWMIIARDHPRVRLVHIQMRLMVPIRFSANTPLAAASYLTFLLSSSFVSPTFFLLFAARFCRDLHLTRQLFNHPPAGTKVPRQWVFLKDTEPTTHPCTTGIFSEKPRLLFLSLSCLPCHLTRAH